MTEVLPVSVIIASRSRPKALRRCLTAISQLDYPHFEVIVVADPAGLAVACDFPVKTVGYATPNISVARNLGIAAAAGEVVAFIDDDAAPEPQWLRELAAAFLDPIVSAAGGFVLGANGISFQWKSGTVDRLLAVAPLDVPEDRTSLHHTQPGRAIEIKGVNCAYRRSVIAGMGGFDPELRYHLDETELNLRLAGIRAVTAAVPNARVHHSKAASEQRRADRTPRSLWDIGASAAVTLRRNRASDDEAASVRRSLHAQERSKLLRLMVSGHIEPRDIGVLEGTFDAGFVDGLTRELCEMVALPDPTSDFLAFPARRFVPIVLSGKSWQNQRLRRLTVAHVLRGDTVRLFLLSPTALFHRVAFLPDGYWLQRGGLFGKSRRSDPYFRFWRFRGRIAREVAISGAEFRNTGL